MHIDGFLKFGHIFDNVEQQYILQCVFYYCLVNLFCDHSLLIMHGLSKPIESLSTIMQQFIRIHVLNST